MAIKARGYKRTCCSEWNQRTVLRTLSPFGATEFFDSRKGRPTLIYNNVEQENTKEETGQQISKGVDGHEDVPPLDFAT